jgi:hypothetical protein
MKAFPTVNWVKQQGQPPNDEGMDLRDYFAAKAMQSYLNNVIQSYTHEDVIVTKTLSLEIIAETAYEIANAMMKAREL